MIKFEKFLDNLIKFDENLPVEVSLFIVVQKK